MHYVKFCEPEKDPLAENIKTYVPYLYNNTENISIPEIIFAYFIAGTGGYVWNYIDVFIMMIGIALTSQFKLFNDDLRQVKGMVKFELFECYLLTPVSCVFIFKKK